MINLSVLAADSTAWLEAFVLLIRYELTTLDAVSLLFANGLFSYNVRFVSVKTCKTPILPITRLARDSNIIVRAWWNCHTVTARLLTPMHYAALTPFVTTFTEKLLRHGTCHGINYLVMMSYIIIK
jgi:hypothetical protein